MPQLRITIESYVDDHQPGFVRCYFVDSARVSHSFVEKVPVVSLENLTRESIYPHQVDVECNVLDQHNGSTTVDLSHPLGLEDSNGESVFTVPSELVTL